MIQKDLLLDFGEESTTKGVSAMNFIQSTFCSFKVPIGPVVKDLIFQFAVSSKKNAK